MVLCLLPKGKVKNTFFFGFILIFNEKSESTSHYVRGTTGFLYHIWDGASTWYVNVSTSPVMDKA